MPLALESRARARFAAAIERDPVPLDEAVLAIAEEEYPDLEVEEVLVRLDRLGERVRARAPARERAASTLSALRQVLVEEEGLRGNDRRLPRSPQLVPERGPGTEGRHPDQPLGGVDGGRPPRGLRLDGVGFPGHFLAKYVSPERDRGLRGRVQRRRAPVRRRVRRALPCPHRGRDLDRRYLDAVAPRQILARMLHNLRRIYVERSDDVRAWWVLDRILMLTPGHLEALRDRGLVAARLGGAAAAARDLEAYLARELGPTPSAADGDDVRRVLAGLRGKRPFVN